MNRLKFFQISTALLLVLNIALLTFGFMSKPKQKNHLAQKISKDLNLDLQQERSFKELGQKHHQAIVKLDEKQKAIVSQVFENLPDDLGALSSYPNLNSAICQLESDKILLTYNHFIELNTLLNKEQKSIFKPVILDVVNGILLNRNKKKQSPEGFLNFHRPNLNNNTL